MPETP